MGRRRKIESQQNKLERIARLNQSIAHLESYLPFFEAQGEQAQTRQLGSSLSGEARGKNLLVTEYKQIDPYLPRKIVNI